MVDVNVRICLNSKAFLHKLVGHGLAYALLGGEDRRNTEVETVDDRVVLGALILL
jgi:hypothetical protein